MNGCNILNPINVIIRYPIIPTYFLPVLQPYYRVFHTLNIVTNKKRETKKLL